MSQVQLIPTVTLVDGTPRASSLDIADRFGKRHERVLDAVRRIITDLPQEFNEHNFVLVDYIDVKGEKRPAYSLTRDAFSLVVMGFTGKEALTWKVRYIEAFNALESALHAKLEAKARRRARPIPLPERLSLTPWDRVQMGPQVMKMLESDPIGPCTLECVLLKLRYSGAISDMLRLCNSLHGDLNRVRSTPYGKLLQAVNKTRSFSDPLIDTLVHDRYQLVKLGNEVHETAFRALNTSICVAKMLDV